MAQTDNLRKYKNLYSSTSNSFGTGTGDTITPASVSGLPTDTEITLTFDRVDSSGTETPSKMEMITGTVSGGNLINYTRGVGGSEQSHTTPVVEMIWNADDWNDMVDWAKTEHNQDGTHGSITTDGNIAASAISASSIGLTSGATVTAFLDEDDLSTDSATAAATQQSIKAYVDPTQTTVASDATPNPTGDKKINEYQITALAEAAEFAAPSGTAANGNILRIRVLDDGTGRALTYNAIYRAVGITLPTTTTADKTVYIGAIYNSADTKWDCVATVELA